MRRHLTGNAKVELFLNCQGKLINYKILKSTSVEMLDNAAKKMIEDAEPYPTPKNCQHNFNINVPIEFKIKN
jgi:TonB family protein